MVKTLLFISILFLSLPIYAEDIATIEFQAYFEELLGLNIISDSELLSFSEKLDKDELVNPIVCEHCSSKQLIHKKTFEDHLAYKEDIDIITLKLWMRKLLAKRGYEIIDREETRKNTSKLCHKNIVQSRISIDNDQICAINKNNKVVCWGGRLVPNDLGEVCKHIYSRDQYTCTIEEGGRVPCWGNSKKELIPSHLNSVLQVSYNAYYYCVLDETGKVNCSFDTPFISCGRSSGTYKACPRSFDTLGPVRQISTSKYCLCVVELDGGIGCWGDCNLDQKKDIGPAVQVFVSDNRICVLEKSGRVKCWGDELLSQVPPWLPIPIVQVIVSREYTCVLGNNKAVVCWGSLPWFVFLELLQYSFLEIYSNNERICGVKDNGKIVCISWGNAKHIINPPYDLEVSVEDLLPKFTSMTYFSMFQFYSSIVWKLNCDLGNMPFSIVTGIVGGLSVVWYFDIRSTVKHDGPS